LEKIIYITPVLVPGSSAASKRILANAKLIQLLNYEVEIYSGLNISEKRNVDGVTVIPSGVDIEKSNGLNKLLAYRKSVLYFIETITIQDLTKLKGIILYSGYSFYLSPLLRWCKKNSIPIIFDAVEWYTPAKFYHWLFKPYFWNTEVAMRYFIPKTKNVIAISTFLDKYYSEKKCTTVVIPPLYYTKTNASIEKEKSYVQLSYTGSPGRKDNLNEILTAILEINKVQLAKEIKLEIAGICEEQLLLYPVFVEKAITELPKNIKAHGYISMDLAQEITSNADFSILFRKNDKTNTAGFPTKVVESLSLGTPLFLNYSSDLHLYLHDNINAVVIDDFEITTIKKAINRILEMPLTKLDEMTKNALETANKNFLISSKKMTMNTFLKQIKI
jgi:glycosyltransferase involved in cell wall biosynthesis